MAEAHDKLLYMARQIETYFQSYGEDEAAKQLADHINAFWSRKMRREIIMAVTTHHFEISAVLQKAITFVRL